MARPVDDGPLELRAPALARDRRRWPLALAVGLVVGLVAAVVLLGPDDGVDVAVEETTTTGAPAPGTDGTFPTPIALGGPTDGKESIGLPVRAEPATGLVDGQEVLVTGTGFPPGVDVGVVMCTREAGRDHGARGVDACNIGHFARGTTDAGGTVTVAFAVRRLVLVDGQEVDCASAPGRCLLGMGMLSDYDTSGGVLVDFDADVPLPDPPTVVVVPATGLADGEDVLVEVTGLVPGTGVWASVCDQQQLGCLDLGPVDGTAGADGTVRFRTRVWRSFGIPTWEPGRLRSNLDCLVDVCQLVVAGDPAGPRVVPAVPLGFAPGPIDREPLEATVVSRGPYGPGDRIEVLLAALGDHRSVELVLCGPETCAAWQTDVDRRDDGVLARMPVVPAAEGNPCHGGPCHLLVNVYDHVDDTRRRAAPPLLPDPIPLEVSG